jgi:PAS domain S-box-containing protein
LPAAPQGSTGTPPPVDELLALLDWLPASVALWDRDVRLRYGNRRALTRFGRAPDELLGAHLSDLVQEHAVELSAQYINGALAGRPQQVERAMVNRAGQRFNAHQVTHIPDVVDGVVQGYCALAVDITASIDGYQQARRAREQAALREQRERIAGDLDRQRVVDELCVALERLEEAFDSAGDAVPSLGTVTDAIDRCIDELRSSVPAQMIVDPGAPGPQVAFPGMSTPVAIAPETVRGANTGVPWPPEITGRGWSQADMLALLDLLPVEVAIWDQALNNVFANRAAVQWFGRTDRAGVLGQHARDLLGFDVFEAANVAYAEAALLGHARQFDRSVIYPGGLRHLQVYVAPRIREGLPDGLYSVVVDVTERVEAELALQEARAELVSARQRERVADHLHNLVIQRLFAAGLAATVAVADEQVRAVQEGIVTALEDLEFAINALHENVGLVDLLPELAAVVHAGIEPYGIAVSIENVGSVDYVPPSIGVELLAVAEAAVSNVASHSGAARVVVTIAADPAGVWLRIADDGRGMRDAPRRGIAEMLARARRLGGTCTWQPGEPGGTVVDFRIPLAL